MDVGTHLILDAFAIFKKCKFIIYPMIITFYYKYNAGFFYIITFGSFGKTDRRTDGRADGQTEILIKQNNVYLCQCHCLPSLPKLTICPIFTQQQNNK